MNENDTSIETLAGIADIRAAIGDEGQLMLSELGGAVRDHITALEAEKTLLSASIRKQDDELQQARDQRDEARQLASEWSNEAGAEVQRLQAELQQARDDRDFIARSAHQERERMERDRQRMKEQMAHDRAASSAAYTLAANLCGVHVVAEKDGHDLIRRESVMDLVTAWRRDMEALTTPDTDQQSELERLRFRNKESAQALQAYEKLCVRYEGRAKEAERQAQALRKRASRYSYALREVLSRHHDHVSTSRLQILAGWNYRNAQDVVDMLNADIRAMTGSTEAEQQEAGACDYPRCKLQQQLAAQAGALEAALSCLNAIADDETDTPRDEAMLTLAQIEAVKEKGHE